MLIISRRGPESQSDRAKNSKAPHQKAVGNGSLNVKTMNPCEQTKRSAFLPEVFRRISEKSVDNSVDLWHYIMREV